MEKIKVFIALLFLMITVLFIWWNREEKIPTVTVQKTPEVKIESKKEPETVLEKLPCLKCGRKPVETVQVVKEVAVPVFIQTPAPVQQTPQSVIINQPPAQTIIIQPQPLSPEPTSMTPPPKEPEHVPETRFTLTLPSGSPVSQPKDRMNLQELQYFTANLFKPHDSPYSKLLNATEAELTDFLQANGYTILKEVI